MDDSQVDRLLAQNDLLIATVRELALASSPVEIVRALNPPLPPAPIQVDPYSGEPEPRYVDDPWADPKLQMGDLRADFVGNALKEVPEP